MKLRVEVVTCSGYPVQTEEFELNPDAVDVITTVSIQIAGQIRVTAVTETPVIGHNLPPGLFQREQHA